MRTAENYDLKLRLKLQKIEKLKKIFFQKFTFHARPCHSINTLLD
jgi:hypothetical protein